MPDESEAFAEPRRVAADGARFDTVAHEMPKATERYRRDDQLVIPQHTHLVSAIAS